MSLSFQGAGPRKLVRSNLQSWQALTDLVYYAEFLWGTLGTQSGVDRGVSHPSQPIRRPAFSVARNHTATTNALSIFFCCSGSGVRFASPSRIPLSPSFVLLLGRMRWLLSMSPRSRQTMDWTRSERKRSSPLCRPPPYAPLCSPGDLRSGLLYK